MERASAALTRARYFEAERLADRALHKAFEANDFARMARICLPLQEARRQKRQAAEDCGSVAVLSALSDLDGPFFPGMYLLQPPLIGADARTFRQEADAQHIATFVLTREPMSRDGLWPIVAVGGFGGADISIRVKVRPPFPVVRQETGPTRDDSARFGPPSPEWFTQTAEALGDSYTLRLNSADPAAWRAHDLILAVDALPSHEKLHQELADACRAAISQPLPEKRRPRPMIDDAFAF
jgi:hypothetical protein